MLQANDASCQLPAISYQLSAISFRLPAASMHWVRLARAMATMDYTTLSLAEVKAGLDDLAREAEATFGGLNARQLNWKADSGRWSVAQCFEHLLTSNG